MSEIALSEFCDLFPPIDAVALSDAECLLLLSQPADPALDDHRGALVLVDRSTSNARVVGEFPGACEMVVWAELTPGGISALVSSPGGTLWRIAPDGSAIQIDDAFGEDGPQQYGSLNTCVTQGAFAYVGGMSNQLYRTQLGQTRFDRMDDGFLDREMADFDAAIYGLADMGGTSLVAVGGGGMMLVIQGREVRRLDSGTNLMINAVHPIDGERFLACGVGGLVLQGSVQGWCRPAESPGFDGYLSAVRVLSDRILWIGNQTLFSSGVGGAWNELTPIDKAPAVSRFSRGGTSLWAIDTQQIGWTNDAMQWEWLPTVEIHVDVVV